MLTNVKTEKQILRSYVVVECVDEVAPAAAKKLRRTIGLPPMPTANSNRRIYFVNWPKASKQLIRIAYVYGHPSDQPHWNNSLIAAFRAPPNEVLGRMIEKAVLRKIQKRNSK